MFLLHIPQYQMTWKENAWSWILDKTNLGWAVPSSVKLRLPAAHFSSCLLAYWITYVFTCLLVCLFRSLPHCLVTCKLLCLLTSLLVSWMTRLLLGLLTCPFTYLLSRFRAFLPYFLLLTTLFFIRTKFIRKSKLQLSHELRTFVSYFDFFIKYTIF